MLTLTFVSLQVISYFVLNIVSCITLISFLVLLVGQMEDRIENEKDYSGTTELSSEVIAVQTVIIAYVF